MSAGGLLAKRSLPTWEVIASLWMHGMILLAILVAERFATPPEPPFKPDEVIMVSMGQLPKQTKAIPDRPSRTPDPIPSEAELPPVTEPAPPPPPSNSDMVLETEKDKPDPVKDPPKTPPKDPPKDPPKAPPKDNTSAREAAIAKAKAGQKDPNAPEGDVDRPRTDPNGGDFVPGELVGINNADPELAKYIQACRDAVMPHWTPLPAVLAAHPEYVVQVAVSVAADGTINKYEVYKGSGDRSFDKTATFALAKVRRLPPPPAAWRTSAEKGMILTFRAKDK